MVLEMKQHIELQTDDPLKAVVAGTRLKAYLVANLARVDGIDAAIEQYGLSRAEIHAALTFYYDNEGAIQMRLHEVEARLKANTIDGWKHIETMRKRVNKDSP